MLFDPGAHEPLTDAAWDPDAVREAIDGIIAATLAAWTERWWPTHPRDAEPGDPDVFHGVYMGAAGVLWALRRLGTEVDGEVGEAPEFGSPGLWMGRGGVLFVDWLHTRSYGVANELFALELEEDTLELMWGSPGMLVIADEMERRTGDPRWTGAAEEIAGYLTGRSEWTQDLYGRQRPYLGPAHGLAGIIAALARRGVVDPRMLDIVKRSAVREQGFVNWPPLDAPPLERNQATCLQWCHGAPGMVTSLASLPPDDELDELLLAGGELTWHAGPLVKGAGLCHGTAGNGYAFLKLFARTQDERWLYRARRFAMHALQQSSRDRFTLFTGDLGVAVYADACLNVTTGFPTVDAW